MLDTLHIENIAVIRQADINFRPGFTVLTGETGAGKSIIIDSINLLLGGKARRDLIRSGETSAHVSAVFTDLPDTYTARLQEAGVRVEEDDSLFVQRSVTEAGKSATRLNGRPASVSTQRELVSELITIHGQHDNQIFLDPASHMGYLDAYAGLEEALSEYGAVYTRYTTLRSKIRSLKKGEQEKARMAELLKYQISDIDAGRLKPKEEEALLEKRLKIRNIEKITKQVNTVYHALYRNEKGYSASELLDKAASALDSMSEIMPEAQAFSEKLSGFRYEIEDIAETVRAYVDDSEGSPTLLLDKVETRLEAIAKLKKKYGATVEEVLSYRKKAAEELEDITMSDEKLEALYTEAKAIKATLATLADGLTALRRAAGEALSAGIMEELRFLDMDKVRFSVAVRPIAADGEPLDTDTPGFGPRGRDSVEFLISTNPGEPLKPLEKIASGGELSRIMLAAKCVMAKTEQVGTMIFDEVDAGVSGKTSQKIGMKLKELGKTGCQVLCVTHSAQIAALGDEHLFISKKEVGGRVETTVTPLDREARIGELSRIIGGLEITDSVRVAAEELLRDGQAL